MEHYEKQNNKRYDLMDDVQLTLEEIEDKLDKKFDEYKYEYITDSMSIQTIKHNNKKPNIIVVDYRTYSTLYSGSEKFFSYFHTEYPEMSINSYMGIPVAVMLDINRTYLEIF